MTFDPRIEEAAQFGAAMLAAAPVKSIGRISVAAAATPIQRAAAAPVVVKSIGRVAVPAAAQAVIPRASYALAPAKPAAIVAVVARPATAPRASAVLSPSKYIPAATPVAAAPAKDRISAAAGTGLAAIIAQNKPDLEKEPNPADAAAIAAKYLNPAPAGGGAVGNVGDGGGGALPDFAPPEEPQYEAYDGGLPADEPTVKAAPSAVQSAAIVKAPEEGFWKKLLALFGFGKKPAAATMSGDPTSLQGAIESIVRRARSGDQNAMALMALVRDNAKKGHPRAQQSYALLNEYVRNHPVNSNPRIGVDYVALTQAVGAPRLNGELRSVEYQIGVDPQLGADPVFADAVALSHGPKLTNPRIGNMLSHFGGEAQSEIEFGMAHRDSPNRKRNSGVNLGKILGHARRLQAVRMPGSSIKKFDANVGWELGDD